MLNKMVGDEHSSDEAVRESLRLTGAMEDHPEPVQDALTKWMREKQCSLMTYQRFSRPRRTSSNAWATLSKASIVKSLASLLVRITRATTINDFAWL